MSELNAYEAFVEQFRREAARKMAAFEHAAKQAAARSEELAKQTGQTNKPHNPGVFPSHKQVGVSPIQLSRFDEHHVITDEASMQPLSDTSPTQVNAGEHREGRSSTVWPGSKKKGKIRGVLRNPR